MKPFYLLLTLTFSFTCLLTKAQVLQVVPEKKIIKCYTVEATNEFRKKHPGTETDAQFETWLNAKIKERKAQRGQASNFTIPVVFHIINKGETVGTTPNLSAAAINQQMLQLNKDFANLSNSPYAVAANTGLQFVLAKTDPGGTTLTEPGIDRIDIAFKGWTDYSTSGWTSSYIDGTVKPASIWNANNYFNVWVIPSINNGTADLLGYATFPASSTLTGLSNSETNNTAGVVVQTGTIGSVFAPSTCGISYGLGKTLSHETGHFFGLRHIWGDADCGDDFCGDTPIHFTSNSGVPQHPKPNSCGTADEMFENYMDYTDDILLNTFTNDQTDRMQTVMVNSPRRVSLASSPVGAIVAAASNKIAFANCTGVLNYLETGTTGTYPRYKDVNITLDVEDKATGPATVTITPTGTAANNFHYQLLTPTLVFAAGDNYKNVRVRIFDNAEVDGNRTIILNYSISGTGVTAGSTATSITINISDNDFIKIGTGVVSLINENFDGSSPAAGWASGSLLSPAGANKWTLGSNGGADVSGRALYITNNTTARPLLYSVDSTSDAIVITPKISTSGYTNPTLSFNYKSNGEADNMGTYDYGRLMFSYNGSTFRFIDDIKYQGDSVTVNTGNIPLSTQFSDTSFYIGFRWQNDDNTGFQPPFLIDDVLLNVSPYGIDTLTGASFGFDVRNTTAANNFNSSTTNSIIASLTNASTTLSGVTAQITQAGSGQLPLTTNTGSYFRTQKVFQVSPATANTTATYQATFYFTETELAIWGANKLNLKIIKIKDGVALNTMLTAANSEIISPTVSENIPAGYIAYTGNFKGFSQFVLASPTATLGVSLLSFTASPVNSDVLLQWSTASETNNKGFFVERSTDGIHFTNAGFVNGNGTTPLTSKYTFTDNFVQPNIMYYYRLRQVDYDGREEISFIRNIRISQAAGIVIKVSPNPAKNFVSLFISGTQNKATVAVTNTLGQKLILKNEVNAYDGAYMLPLNNLARGTYNVVVYLPEGTYSKKIIIE